MFNALEEQEDEEQSEPEQEDEEKSEPEQEDEEQSEPIIMDLTNMFKP